MKPFTKFKTLNSYANHIARLHFRTNRATEIVQGEPGSEPRALSYTQPGYRKYSDGQYVPNKYRSHFGWKNTYYQRAECVVSIPADIIIYFQLRETP